MRLPRRLHVRLRLAPPVVLFVLPLVWHDRTFVAAIVLPRATALWPGDWGPGGRPDPLWKVTVVEDVVGLQLLGVGSPTAPPFICLLNRLFCACTCLTACAGPEGEPWAYFLVTLKCPPLFMFCPRPWPWPPLISLFREKKPDGPLQWIQPNVCN